MGLSGDDFLPQSFLFSLVSTFQVRTSLLTYVSKLHSSAPLPHSLLLQHGGPGRGLFPQISRPFSGLRGIFRKQQGHGSAAVAESCPYAIA